MCQTRGLLRQALEINPCSEVPPDGTSSVSRGRLMTAQASGPQLGGVPPDPQSLEWGQCAAWWGQERDRSCMVLPPTPISLQLRRKENTCVAQT